MVTAHGEEGQKKNCLLTTVLKDGSGTVISQDNREPCSVSGTGSSVCLCVLLVSECVLL